MTPFDILKLLGGLCLFLFGMDLMGQGLERRAGNGLRDLLERMTNRRFLGFLTGLGVTAVIQSSSATTVMVVGFVNSSIMTLRQAINVIMGANVGTTVTSWILSLSGISEGAWYIKMLKPMSFTPILALIGIIFYMFCKSTRKKDTGTILLGFSTLMFGMNIMTEAVSVLEGNEAFANFFLKFENPLLGMLAGAVLTAAIQSSSASVGILQALCVGGVVSYSAAIPIIMGQNIGTCVTALISCLGTSKNAKRAALVHLFFNAIGTTVWLTVFSIVKSVANIPMLNEPATGFGIAICHSAFNILCVLLLFPMASLLEKLVKWIIPDAKEAEETPELDDRLLATPTIALGHARKLVVKMAEAARGTLSCGIALLKEYSPELVEKIKAGEESCDHYEDILSTYLVKLSACGVGDDESAEAAELLRVIGDLERISDHGKNLLESVEELREKGFSISDDAREELVRLTGAVEEVMSLSLRAFSENDMVAAKDVAPLEDVVDDLKEALRTRHILRMQQGKCSIEVGFVWSDLLTNLERTSDHCSNIALCVIDRAAHNMNSHEAGRQERDGVGDFTARRHLYEEKYALPPLLSKSE